MNNLSRCLLKHSKDLKDFDTGEVVEASQVYVSRGRDEDEANALAIEDHLDDLRSQRKRIAELVIEQFKAKDPAKFAQIEAKAKGLAPAPKAAPAAAPVVSEKERGIAMAAEGIDELISLLGGKSNLLPEEEARIIPVMSKIFRGAAIAGYATFKDAARWVYQQIHAKSPAVAEKLSIENLQAGYINIAKEIGGDKRSALDYDSIEQLMADEPEANPEIEAAAHAAATSPLNNLPQPTDKQKEVGNYKVGPIPAGATRIGMPISIENPRGSVRSGTSPDGKKWQNTLAHHYGYIKGTTANDGDHLDIFLTNGAETAGVAWVIDQKNPDGSFDEHKIVLGPTTESEARAAYLANYAPGWDGIGAITSMPVEAFKSWASDGKPKRKPLAYVEAQKPSAGKALWEMSADEFAAAARRGRIVKATGKFSDRERAYDVERKGQETPLGYGEAAGYSADDIAHFYANHPSLGPDIAVARRMMIKHALREGKAVPAEILADFPDLKAPDSGAKPERVAESADEMFAYLNQGEGGILHNGNILYPAIRVIGMPGMWQLRDGKVMRLDTENGGISDAKTSDADDVIDALQKDQAQIVLLSHWGGSGRDVGQKVVSVLHSPKGNSFGAAAKGGAVGAATTKDSSAVATLLKDADFPISPEDARADEMAVEAAEAVERKNQAEAKSEKELYGPRKVGTRVVTYNNIRFNLEYTARAPEGTRETEYWIGDEATGARSAQYTLHDGWKTPSEIVAMLQETKDPDAQWWSELIIGGVLNPSKPTRSERVVEGEADTERHENATAPEHIKDDTGVTVAELKQIAKAFRAAIDGGADAEVTHVFDAPLKGEIVNLEKKAGITAKNVGGKRVYHRDAGWMTLEEARAHVEQWKEHARAQNDTESGNWTKVVLSLFDKSGAWSEPWEAAGYQVYRFDIQNNETNTIYDEDTGEEREINTGDINEFSVNYFSELYGAFDGNDVYAVLAACPCTDFAVSGARHFAAKDYDGRTVASIKLVKATLATIEYFKPPIWALENPVGRIEELTGLPPWRLSFDPSHFGDPYTKKTLLWGRFNADLPVAPVEPTEGSKMHSQYGGKSQATKDARSVTPEGFAYAFFMANNAADHPAMAISGKYDRLDRSLIEKAVKAGITESEIDSAVEDFYYQELNDDAANDAIRDLIAQNPTPKGGLPAVQQQLFVKFDGQTFPVESLRDASEKWERFRDTVNAGYSEIGNGVPIFDQTGKQVAYVSYNGKVWPGKDYNPNNEALYDPYTQDEAALPQEIEVSEDSPAKDGPRYAIGQRVTIVSGKFAGTGAVVGAHFPVPGNVDTGESVDYALTMDGGKGGAVLPEAFIKAESAGEIADTELTEKRPTSQWLHDDIVLLIDQKGRTKDRKALNKVVELLKQRMDGEDIRAARVKTYTIKFKREPKIAEVMDRVVARLETEDREATNAKRRANKQAKEGQNGTETTQAEPQPEKQPPAVAAPGDAAVAAPNTGFVKIGVSPDGVEIWANAAGTRQRREGGVVIGEMLRAGGESQKPSWDRYQTKEEADAPKFYVLSADRSGDRIAVASVEDAAEKFRAVMEQSGADRPGIDVYDAATGQPVAHIDRTGKVVDVETREQAAARSEAAAAKLNEKDVTADKELATLILNAADTGSRMYGQGVANRLYGPDAESARQTILSALTGEKVPKSKAGHKATMQALYDRFGVMPDAIVTMQNELDRKLSEATGKTVAQEGATESAEAATPEFDEKGNPVRRVGDRVEITDGQYAGRHGEVTDVNRSRTVAIGVARNVRSEWISYHYNVRSDNGTEFYASPDQLKTEESRPESVVMDPVVNGRAMEPEALHRSIGYDRQSAQNFRAKAQRARKSSAIAEHKRAAERSDASAVEKQAIWDEWAAKNPEAAEKIAPKPAAKAPQATPQDATVAAAPVDVAGAVKAAGLVVTKTTTKNDKPVWEVSGNTRDHSGMLKSLGGRWYGPKKVWSFYNDDPSVAIAGRLGVTAQPAAPQIELGDKEVMLPGNPYVYRKEASGGWTWRSGNGNPSPLGAATPIIAQLEAALAAKNPVILGQPAEKISDKALEALVDAETPTGEKARAEAEARAEADEPDIGAIFDNALDELFGDKPVVATPGPWQTVLIKAGTAVTVDGIDYTVRNDYTQGHREDGEPVSLRTTDRIAKVVDKPYEAISADAGKAKKKIINPATPEGYAAALADPAILDEYQDELDAYFQERLIAVRNALRDLGWVRQGNATGDPLEKDGKAARFSFRYAGGGAKNVVGMTVNDVEDRLTLTPEKFALLADKTSGLTQARQDLDEMQAQHQKKGNYADDRLAGQIERQKKLIEEYKVEIAALDPVKVGADETAEAGITGKIENAKRRLRETRNEIEQVSGGVSDANRKKTAELRAKESEIEREIRGLRQQALEQGADGQNDELDAEMRSYEEKAGAAPAAVFAIGDKVNADDGRAVMPGVVVGKDGDTYRVKLDGSGERFYGSALLKPVKKEQWESYSISESNGRYLVREPKGAVLATFGLSENGVPQRVDHSYEAEATRGPVRKAIEKWAQERRAAQPKKPVTPQVAAPAGSTPLGARDSSKPYERLLAQKSTALMSESGGRKLYSVEPTAAFKEEFFAVGRGWNLPRSDAFEFVEKASVTGNPSDNGYVLIDKRGQAPRTAGQAATSAAKNTAMGLKDVAKGLNALFKPKPGTLGMAVFGAPFDEETYAAAKPLFMAGIAHFKQAGADIGEMVKALLKHLMDQSDEPMERATLEAMKPYIVKFIGDVKAGKVVYDENEEVANNDSGTQSQGGGSLEGMAPGEVGEAGSGGQAGPGTDAGGNASGAGNQGVDGPRGKTRRSRGNRAAADDTAEAGNQGNGEPGAGQGTAGDGEQAPGDGSTPPKSVIPLADFVIGEDVALGSGGQMTKYRDNIAAIRLIKTLETERRRATAAEQRVLARYVGWGGIPNAFRNGLTGEVKKDWAAEVAELEGLLTPRELRAASASTRNAHYTAKEVVDFMWRAAARLGFNGGLVLEPSVGTGNFIGLMPEFLRANTHVTGIELDSLTARIAGALYPRSNIIQSGFEKLPLPDNRFDLAIGNPPFGSESLRFKFSPELNGASIHNQFFRASIDAVNPGGLQIMVVSRFLMDKEGTQDRIELAKKAKLLGAIRLPGAAFKGNALTEVVTDILFLQRRPEKESGMIQEALYERGKKVSANETDGARKLRLEREALLAEAMEWVETGTVKDPAGGDPMTVNRYFITNPQMIAGVMNRTGSMRQQNDIDVKLADGETLEQALNDRMRFLPGISVPARSDEINERTKEQHRLLGESMTLYATGAEEGAIRYEPDGSLSNVIERVGENGELELAKVTLTPNSPWSPQLAMNMEGKWFRVVPKLDKDGKPVKKVVNGKATKLNVYEREVFEKESDVPKNLRLGEKDFAKMKQLINIRDLMVEQINLETNTAPVKAMEGNRTKLREAYNAFVKDHGYISEKANSAIVAHMPDEGLLLSLESNFKREVTAAKAKRTGMKESPPTAQPAAILSRPVGIPPVRSEHADTIGDAVAITMSETGRLDLDRIQQLRDIPMEQVQQELTEGDNPLAYPDPEVGYALVDKNAYLSGNVRRKLEAARAADLKKNVAALEAVQPAPWSSDQVTPKMGASWIPPQVFAEFIDSLLGGESRVTFAKLTNTFSVTADRNSAAATARWGTERMPAPELISLLLNSRKIAVYDPADRDGGPYFNQTETDAAQDKAREVLEAFDDWIFKDAERRRTLTQLFNDEFNVRVNRQHDGSHMKFPGKVPDDIIKFRRNQINAIWRGVVENYVLYDHAVGAGKTFTGIARAMERRRMGLSKKPMIVVPNHLVKEWMIQVYRLYPGAKVLAAGKQDMEAKNRRRMFAKIATGDWDIVIVPHSSFGFINLSQETEERFLTSQLEVANAALKEAEAEQDPDSRFKSLGVKAAEALIKKLENRLDAARSRNRDRLVTFEQMGVDDLTVDESHEFKNLMYSTNLTDVRGMGNASGSNKALDMYMKVKLLHESGGSVAFMTGTPISNSAVEMYGIMRYLAPDLLNEMGLEHFDAFRLNFVDATSEFEPTDSGSGIKAVNRLGRQWSNMRSLMDAYYSVADVVTNDDIKQWYAEDNPGKEFPLPKVAGGERRAVGVKPTPTQLRLLMDVVSGFDSLQFIEDVRERNAERLRLMDRARKVSLHAKALDPKVTDEAGGKLDVAVGEIFRLYKKWDANKGTQLVFLDRGVPKSKGDDKIVKAYDDAVAARDAAARADDQAAFDRAVEQLEKFDADEIAALRDAQTNPWNGYQHIKDGLVAKGVPENEIAFIQNYNSDEDKESLFNAVRDGTVRVLIGSTPRMGAGTNVQDLLVGLHHIDATWKPSDIEQREGRIIRQGNLFNTPPTETAPNPLYRPGFEVEILAYVTERTVDAKLWALNSMKLKMINAIRHYDGAFEMEFDDEESASMAEISAIASGDPLTLERFKLTSEVDTLYRQARSFRRRIDAATDSLDQARRLIKDGPEEIKRMEETAVSANALVDAMMADVGTRSMTMLGKTYSDAHDAQWDLAQEISKQKGDDEKAKISVVINGKEYTSKSAAEEAVAVALGDSEPFLGEINGKKTIRRGDYARGIRDIIGDEFRDLDEAVPAGSIYGMPVFVEAKAGRYGGHYVNLHGTHDNGRVRISVERSVTPEKWKDGQPVPITVTGLRALISSFEGEIVRRANNAASIDYLKSRMARAASDIPALEQTITEKFKHGEEYAEKEARLRAVEAELAARAAAKAQSAQTAMPPGWYRVTDDKGVKDPRDRELSADQIKELVGHGYTLQKARQIDVNNYLYRSYKSRGEQIVEVVERAPDVVIDKMPDHKFFAFKDDKIWHVIEASTGISVGRGDTKKEAIDTATDSIEKNGADKVKARIEELKLTEQQKRDAVNDYKDRENKNTAQSPEAGYNDPYDNLETRPGTNDDQLREGRDASRSVERAVFGSGVDRVRGGSPTVLGLAISKDFREDGGTSFTGKQVSNPRDLALLAQVVRDPRFETVRIFYTRGDVIVGQAAMSSRLPAAVYLTENFASNVAEGMTRFNADGYWMVHNHPSGSSTPSKTDEQLTADTAREVPGFRGHVVIDHNEYSTIEVDPLFGATDVRLFKDDALGSTGLTENPTVVSPFLGERLSAPVATRNLAKNLQVKDGFIVVVGTDALNGVRIITEVADAAAKPMSRGEGLRNLAMLRKMRTSAGIYRMFAIVPGDYTEARYSDILNSGIFTDVVGRNGAAAERGDGNLSGNLLESRGDKKRAGTPWFVEDPAYHGSPYEIDRFSTAHIGTGEGAQAYGWGLYFASAKAVAQHYKEKLSEVSLTLNGKPITAAIWATGKTPEVVADAFASGRLVDAMRYAKGSTGKAIAAEAKRLAGEADQNARSFNDPVASRRESLVADRLREFAAAAKAGDMAVTKGRLYAVELAPEQDDYLDWDKSLSRQSEKAKAAIEAIKKAYPDMWEIMEERQFGGPTMDQVTGRDLYRELSETMATEVDDMVDGGWSVVQNTVNDRLANDEAASKYLHSLGIRGIKYKDGSSRYVGAEDWKVKSPEGMIHRFGSRREVDAYVKGRDGYEITEPKVNFNYVIFDDADITITAMESRGRDYAEIIGGIGADNSPSAVAFRDIRDRFEDVRDVESGELPRSISIKAGDLLGSTLDIIEDEIDTDISDDDTLTIEWKDPPPDDLLDMPSMIVRVQASRESRGTVESTGATTAEIRRAFVKAFGESVVRAQERAGLIEILPDAAALRVLLPGVRISNNAKALFFGDRAYFIADRMNPATAHREALHEIGEHYGLKRMLGNDGYRALINRVKAMRNDGDDYVSRAWNFVVREYVERESDPRQKLVEGGDRFMHEVLAQIGQNADVRTKPWWREMIAAVRRWLVKTFGFTGGVSSADIQDMVLHSLKTAVRPDPRGPGGGIRGSQMANTSMASAAPSFGAVDTSSPEFKAWFGGSKVVDADGKPLRVYHGTTAAKDFSKFKAPAYFTTDADAAQIFGEDSSSDGVNVDEYGRETVDGSRVIPVYLSINNPMVMRDFGDFAEWSARNRTAAEKRGYDGLKITMPDNGETLWMAFRPEQIKSTISNTGDFDPENPDIRYSQRGPWYYSALAATVPGMSKIADKQGMVSAEQAKSWLQARQKEGKFKADELNWSGVLDWLDMEASKPVLEPGFGVVEQWRRIDGGEWEQVDDLGSYHRTRAAAEAAIPGLTTASEPDPEFESRFAVREWPELDFGKRGARVAVADIERFVRENGVRVEEVTLGLSGLDEGEGLHVAPLSDDENGEWAVFRGEEDDPLGGTYESQEAALRALDAMRGERPTVFGRPDLVLPGGENYRELLITLPPNEVDEVIDIGKGPFEVRQSQGKFYIVDRLGEWGETPYDSREAAERAFPAHSTRTTKRPTSPLFESRHFPGTPNILAHVRFNERTDASGKRVLFIEEIQSDWAQDGRKRGFEQPAPTYKPSEWEGPRKITGTYRRGGEWVLYEYKHKPTGETLEVDPETSEHAGDLLSYPDLLRTYAMENFEARELNGGPGAPGSVRSAPFITDTKAWTSLALKRMIAYAAENGFDSIAWTTGEQQNNRYDLSKQVSRVEISRPQDGSYAVYAYKQNTDTVPVIQTRVNSKDELADLLGKEFAEKVAKQVVGTKRDYTGLDLKVGGEGMKGYYDQIVPQVAKKLGAEVGSVRLPLDQPGIEGGAWDAGLQAAMDADGFMQPGFVITDAMREKALAGLPLFSKGSAALQRSGKNLVGDDVSLLHVLDIESLQAFTVIDTKTRQPLGAVTLGFDAGGDIAMLADIQAYDKGAGIGSRILGAVLETAPEDVYIVNMLPDAVGFWQKMGVRLDENYSTEWRSGNGFLSAPGRENAQQGGAAEVARDAAGSRAQGNGAPGEGQDQLESRGNFIDDESAAFLRNNRPAPVDRISSIIRNPDRWFQPVLDGAVGSLRGSSLFGSLDRSVHTQLHKAQKNPYFGAVFNRLQHFMADSSRAALRPAELAPTVLPRIDVAQSIRPAFEALVKGKAAAADIDAAFQVALAGTLNDTVYRNADEAGLTAEQFRIYREYRDSIDASLDELAAGEAWRIARTLFLNDRNRLTPEGQAMKKRMLDDPTEAAGSLSGFISRELDTATLRAQQLAAVAREQAPFIENTGDDMADMKKGLRGDGSVPQVDAMRRAIEAIERADALRDTAERVGKIFSRVTQLQGEGYAPLMRFGQHYLTVTRLDPISGEPELNDDGEKVVEYFSLFESAAERDKAEREMRELYGEDPSVEFDSGTMSEKAWERYQGVSPESLALFAETFAVEIGEAFQQYYRVAASTRSTLKRLIHRKGTPGFSTDGSRVLASFLTSNGRRAATLYHEGDIQEALSGFPKQMGREQDEAIELVRYVMDNPNEEAAAPRALMFMHFLGGTVSNFIINATQPAMVTLPYLSKTVGMTRAMALLKEAYGIRNKPEEMSAELRGALERADQEGKVGAQEIHHLWQETARPIISKLGRFGDAVTYRAHAFMQLWGMPFAVAELMNRQVTFISAYNAAKESGKTPNQAYSAAIRAVDETQFIYGKQNRPNWARGTWGSLIFTFKLFSISYTELLVRLAREGAEGRKAALYMLGMLFLAAGAQGMPGADDLDDLIDTLAQMMGYNVSMKLSKRQFLERVAGKEFAGFAMHGLSSLTPLDVSGRMSLGNLLPATDLLKPSNSKKESALLEIMGPVGGLATSYLNTADAVATGNWRRASTEWLPKAFKDLAQGAEMMASGEAKDTHGRRVTEISPVEAAVKMAGFNPQAVAEVGRNARAVQQTIALATRTKGVITEKWARGIVDRNPEDVAAAKRDIDRWNAANPETPITIKLSAVALRANAMRATKEDRFIKAATKEMKDYVKEAL